MTDPTAIHAHLSSLTTALNALTTALAPLLATAPAALARDLPARDAARLHILAAYAPESLLFNAVRLADAGGGSSGGNDGGGGDGRAGGAKGHAVVGELRRVKTYAAKLRDAEARAKGPAMRLDRDAARRFVKAGIASDRETAAAAAEQPAEPAAARKRGVEAPGGDSSPRNKKQRQEDRRRGGVFELLLIKFWTKFRRPQHPPEIAQTAERTKRGIPSACE